MGPITSEHQVKTGAVNIDMTAGPQFASPFHILSVCYTRVTAGAIDIVLLASWQDREFVIDEVTATTALSYTFPNSRVPYPIALPENCKIHFKTDHMAASGENHAVIVQWAQGT